MTTLKSSAYVPRAKRLIEGPSQEELMALTAEMSNARPTSFGNYNVQTRVVARSAGSTFIATDSPDGFSSKTISRDDAVRMASMQDEYIRDQEMVVVDGAIGHQEPLATPARLIIERRHANIAGMQDVLYFPAAGRGRDPESTIIYTPNLAAAGLPGGPRDHRPTWTTA